MSEIFFTSDTHFAHKPNFLWEPRGFTCVDEMNETIIERWNNIVKPSDIVYHLGDFFLNDNEKGMECLNRLNGNIFAIWGNHETESRKNLIVASGRISGGYYAHVIKYDKFSFYLSHYPTLTANYDDKYLSQHVISLHGHTHQCANFLYPNNPFMYHVGVDSHNCTPIHIDEVVSEIRQRWFDLQHLKIPMINDLYSYPMS